jgi:hypothetical protein
MRRPQVITFLALAGLTFLVLFLWEKDGRISQGELAIESKVLLEAARPTAQIPLDRGRIGFDSGTRVRLQLVSSFSGENLPEGAVVGHPEGRLQAHKEGLIEVPPFDPSKAKLTAQCPGYFSRDLIFRIEDNNSVVVIELEPDFRLNGRVVDLLGESVAEGVLVVAYYGTRPSPAEFYKLGTLDGVPTSRYSFAWTDHNGEFEIRNLEPGYFYSLVAGGKGLISPISFKHVIPTLEKNSMIEVQVAHTWGVLLNVETEDGLPLAGNGQLFQGMRGLAIQVSGAQGAQPLPNLPWLTMLGMEPDKLTPKLPTTHQRREVFWGKPLAKNPKLNFYWKCPGYYDSEISVEMKPLENGIQVETLSVVQEASGFGSLQVEISGSMLDDITGGNTSSPDIAVEIFPLDEPYLSRDFVYRCMIPCAKNGVYEIDGIPFGLYNVGFKSRNKYWSTEPLERAIRISSQPESVTVDLSGVGLAMVNILDEDGFELPLKVRTRFHRWGPKSGHYAFEYIRPSKNTITLLPPGDYRFYAEKPYPKGYEPVKPDGHIVAVGPDSMTEVNMALRKLPK